MAKITRTYGPIHFEDLDPHRFEDLIRELIYDHKEWQSIEATGKSGNDGGIDIRAYEKIYTESENGQEENNNGLQENHPMEGNLWIIQCKREKEIGPKRLRGILSEIDKKNPPYGYILASSANFSKDSYDVFREELKKIGVMEFYLWGKPELEDMLHLPKNDRILFTFFGISLVSKRRSRATEIRFSVNNKNKLLTILGENLNTQPILLRDSKDTNYPYKAKYKDFTDRPRWREYTAIDYHPLGLIFSVREHFAYIDPVKKEFDYVENLNLIYRETDTPEERQTKCEIREKIEDFWNHMPRLNKAMFFKNRLVYYDQMLVIDSKGDNWHKFPHIFIDFDGSWGPFGGSFEFLKIGEKREEMIKEYKRVRKFPKLFSIPKIGKIHDAKGITLDDQIFRLLKRDTDQFFALFACDDRYNFLRKRDVVPIENKDGENSSKYYLQITNVENIKVKDYLKRDEGLMWKIEQQIGKNPDPEEMLNVYEFKKTYDFVIEREKKRRESGI